MEDARTCGNQLAQAKTIADFDKHWRAWLRAIQRIWHKLEDAGRSHAQFQAIKSAHRALERTDELIRYIKQARDVDEHSVRDVAGATSRTTIRPVNQSAGIYVQRMEIRNGQLVTYQGTPIHVEQLLTMVLLPVVNRGVVYAPPQKHLGEIIENSPLRVIELAMAYYGSLVDRADRECVERR